MRKFFHTKKHFILLLILTTGAAFIALRAGLLHIVPELPSIFSDHTTPGIGAVTEKDNLFLQELRTYIAATNRPDDAALIHAFGKTSFPKNAHGVILSVHQPGRPLLRTISTKKTTEMNLLRAAIALKSHVRAPSFRWNDPKTCRIQIDFITGQPEPVKPGDLCEGCVSPQRFEPGIDGFITESKGPRKYFLPGDAFRLSIYSLKAAVQNVTKTWGKTPQAEIQWLRIRTQSFISYENSWIALYRGAPVITTITRHDILRAIERAVDHTVRHQRPEGRFLYYYDSAKDSFIDHEHPTRDPQKNPYYNELRHCGGVLMLLQEYERTKNQALLGPIQRGVTFAAGLVKEYTLPSGEKAGYYYYNAKAKLGGSGISLYLLAEYQRITGDNSFVPTARLLHRHLLAQILPSGEFMYYAIFLDKIVPPQDNSRLFNFYYPGEAIVGLVQYVKHVSQDQDEKKATLLKIKAALRFLLEDRPKYYAQAYTSLPSDSWLMMGINELWDIPEARDPRYAKFVFNDADKMFDLMYTPQNALYADYPGAFSYQHGDLPYADGARAEGVLAATFLAKKTGDTQRFHTYLAKTKLVAWALAHLVNTPEAMYFAKNPDLAVGGVRFKHTRQWFRIDTTAHVISFYLKFLPLLKASEAIQPYQKKSALIAPRSAKNYRTVPLWIHALQYVPSDNVEAQSKFGWFTFLVQMNGQNILLDTALEYPLRNSRWGIKETRSLPRLLKPLRVSPEMIHTIIITHADADHVDQLNAFPKATVYIHRDAYAELAKVPGYKDYLKQHARKIKTFSSITRLPGGITIHPAPGEHAPGMSIVSIKTNDKTYIFPSDLCRTAAGCCEKIRFISSDLNALCALPDKVILPHHEHYETGDYGLVRPAIYKIK